MWKRNGDWYGDVRINIGQEEDEGNMKLLNRNTRQNRELYKEIQGVPGGMCNTSGECSLC